jgi:hypothetical protein
MTEHFTPEIMIALGGCTQPPETVVQRLLLSLLWTLDPNTGRPTGRWVIELHPCPLRRADAGVTSRSCAAAIFSAAL